MTKKILQSPKLVLGSAFLLLTLWGCGGAPETGQAPTDTASVAEAPAPASEGSAAERPVEATDLFGEPLRRPALGAEFAAEQQALLEQALADREAAPESLDAWVWVGRRQAYLARYGEAIGTYSEALERLGERAELYRHRGHRYLTTRQYEAAQADFERAAELIEGQPDVVEQDGLPNARNIPTSTLGTNIFYHLGLALYLQGDFEGARQAYEACMELSKNDDMRVATAYWQYMTLRRLGLDREAESVLAPFDAEMDIIENGAYRDLLLLFRESAGGAGGDGDALLSAARETGEAALATTGYGVGMDAWLADDSVRPAEIWREIVATDAWASFGYLAAEAELVRLVE